MRVIAIFTLALAAVSACAADVYRSVAADGTVIYSDRPSGPNAQPIYLASQPRPTPLPPAAPPASESEDEDLATLDAAEASRIQQELAEQRERNCAIARARAENYNAAHRLYRELPNGEREYLDDAQIDEARAQAAADVEAWCG